MTPISNRMGRCSLRRAAMLVLVMTGMAGALPAIADTPAPINPDIMTVSGRFGLPKGDHLIIHRRLRVGAITVDPAALTGLAYDAGGFKFALEQALIKSLVNHDLMARPDDTDVISLQVTLPALTYTEVADTPGQTGSTAAEARLHVTTTSTDPAMIACVTYEGHGEFTALHRQKSGGGKRAAGIIAAVVIGAINPYAINTFTPQSFSNANLENQNLNARRSVSANQGISPGFDARSNATYAATNAAQLAIYNYLYHQLNDNPACQASIPEPQAAGPPPLEVTADPANPPPAIIATEPPVEAPPVSPAATPAT